MIISDFKLREHKENGILSDQKDDSNLQKENVETKTLDSLESKGTLPVNVFDPGGRPNNSEAKDAANFNKTEVSNIDGKETSDEEKIKDNDEDGDLERKTADLNLYKHDEVYLSLPDPLFLLFPPVWDPGGLCLATVQPALQLQQSHPHH